MATRTPLYLDFEEAKVREFESGDAFDSADILGAVPTGGLTGQVLKKNTDDPYDLVWGTIAGGGDMLGANNLSDVANVATARTNLGLNTTANQTDSTDKRYVTDANLTVIGNTSGTNSGDNATNSQYSGLAASKQDVLVSGTNIKTVNGSTLLGSGDLTVSAISYSPGSITILTETGRLQIKTLKLTTTQMLTIKGTGRLSIIT